MHGIQHNKNDVEHMGVKQLISVKPLQICSIFQMLAVGDFFAFVKSNLKSGEDAEACLNFLDTLDMTHSDKTYCVGMLERRIKYNLFTVQPSSYDEIRSVAMAGILFCKLKIDNQDSEEDTDEEHSVD
jgi:hypothetical protein